MTTPTLPADTVQFYNDGPEFPTTPLLLKAEQAYREGFATTASAVASWKRVDEDMIEEMWRSRRAVRRKAEILVPSAELFDRPDMDSEQIAYRAGHDVEAARARGKVHGLEFARQCWDELEAEGISKVLIGPLVLAPWAEQIRESRDSNERETRRGLNCRACGHWHFRVIYMRAALGGKLVRRRECRKCGVRLTTPSGLSDRRQFVAVDRALTTMPILVATWQSERGSDGQ